MTVPTKRKTKTKTIQPKSTKTRRTPVIYTRKISPLPKFPLRLNPSKKRTRRRAIQSSVTDTIESMTVISEEPEIFEEYPDPGIMEYVNGVYCLEIDHEVQTKLNCIVGRDLIIDHHWKYVPRELIRKHIDDNAENSPFFPISQQLKRSTTDYVLLLFDKNLLADYLFICVEPISEYKMNKFALGIKKAWGRIAGLNHIRPLKHYKSKTAAFHKFVMKQNRKFTHRDKLMIGAFVVLEDRMEEKIVLSSVEADQLTDGHVCFEPSSYDINHGLKRLELFKKKKYYQKQVVPFPKNKLTQTEDSVRVNKIIQKDYLFLEKIDYRTTRKVINMLRCCYKFLSKSISEYRKVDLYQGLIDGYKANYHLYKKHKNIFQLRKKFFLVKPALPADNWTFVRQSFKIIPHYMEFESISCIAWHPRYIDLIAIAYRGYIHVGKDHDLDKVRATNDFDKIIIPDDVIVVWKLSKELSVARIIICQCEIRALQYNVDYPSLLAGANTDGQIMLWDMNNYYRPENDFLKKMSKQFGDKNIPWHYIPPNVTHATLESNEVFSHEDCIYDLQWLPSNSRIYNEGEVDLSGKIRSGHIVTASEDGTVGFWSLQSLHSILRTIKKRPHRLSKTSADVPAFLQYDRHMIPDVKYIVAKMGGEPVPVTAVSVNNMRQWVIPGRMRTNYFSYKSMRNALKRQRPMMHCSITAALNNGGVYSINPKLTKDIDQRATQVRNVVEDRDWQPFMDAKIQAYCFRHEGVIACLRRCEYADDMILSVSMSSFCIWKEQSKLYKERKKKIPWLRSWYSEQIHDYGPTIQSISNAVDNKKSQQGLIQIQPVFWRRNHRLHTQYVNGNWSSHESAAVYLLTSDGFVEVWDLRNQDKCPAMTMRVGMNSVNYAYPLTFSTREDQVAFIEEKLLYFAKIPDGWKNRTNSERKYLQKTGGHEIWRRAEYYAWNLRYEQDFKEEVQQTIWKFQELCRASRIQRITREYIRCKFIRAFRIKRRDKKVAWRESYPFKWWQKEWELATAYYLKKKKMPLKWTVVQERIPLLVYNKTFTDHTVPKDEVRIIESSHYDWRSLNITREYFKLYWKIRNENKHKYDHLYIEHGNEDKAIADLVDVMHEEEARSRDERITEFGIIYSFQECYSWRKYLDLYIKIPRTAIYNERYYLRRRCNTKFSIEYDQLYRTTLLNKKSARANQEDAGLEPPMNKIYGYWVGLGIFPKTTNFTRVP